MKRSGKKFRDPRPQRLSEKLLGKRSVRDSGDKRDWAQRDRDRILYSDPLRRLAGITQIVGSLETHSFHNRLTHTLKVAQVARRIAERLYSELVKQKVNPRRFVNPDVAEAAGLAHDLGHPPFGHVAEKKLDKLVRDAGNSDGFEGNAQTFRILTYLAAHRERYDGLDLSRATLNAVLKYPWLRLHPVNPENPSYDREKYHANPHEKFGAYRIDKEAFEFAREHEEGSTEKCLEAEIMDYADDVAYAVHDLFDFYKVGIFPVGVVTSTDSELRNFVITEINPLVESMRSRYKKDLEKQHMGEDERSLEYEKLANYDVERDIENLASVYLPKRPFFSGTHRENVALQQFISGLISDLLDKVSIRKSANSHDRYKLYVPFANKLRILFLKELIMKYVIKTQRLTTQQHGQVKVIETLFDFYKTAIEKRNLLLLPNKFDKTYQRILESGADGMEIARLTADIVASLSEAQAFYMFGRITGAAPGKISDLIAIVD